MKILLDECVDRRFARELPDHEVQTVPRKGWAGLKNGELLSLAAAEFDLFITVDRNLSYQQDISRFDIAVLVLRAASNRFADLKPFGRLVLESLDETRAGTTNLISIS